MRRAVTSQGTQSFEVWSRGAVHGEGHPAGQRPDVQIRVEVGCLGVDQQPGGCPEQTFVRHQPDAFRHQTGQSTGGISHKEKGGAVRHRVVPGSSTCPLLVASPDVTTRSA